MKDSHLHLTDPRLYSTADAALATARAHGITAFLSCSAQKDDWEKLARLAARAPDIVPFFGLHPWYAAAESARDKGWLANLEATLRAHPQAGIGEIGLDKLKPDFSAQITIFTQQLQLARSLRRPVVLHIVKAHEEALKLLRELAHKNTSAPAPAPLPKIMLHSFFAPIAYIKPFADLGCFFSLSPFALKKSPVKLAELVQNLPQGRLLLETDAPDGTPQPAYLQDFAKVIAKVLNMPYNQLERLTDNNVKDFLL